MVNGWEMLDADPTRLEKPLHMLNGGSVWQEVCEDYVTTVLCKRSHAHVQDACT